MPGHYTVCICMVHIPARWPALRSINCMRRLKVVPRPHAPARQASLAGYRGYLFQLSVPAVIEPIYISFVEFSGKSHAKSNRAQLRKKYDRSRAATPIDEGGGFATAGTGIACLLTQLLTYYVILYSKI